MLFPNSKPRPHDLTDWNRLRAADTRVSQLKKEIRRGWSLYSFHFWWHSLYGQLVRINLESFLLLSHPILLWDILSSNLSNSRLLPCYIYGRKACVKNKNVTLRPQIQNTYYPRFLKPILFNFCMWRLPNPPSI